jgi:dTDP-4-dehydrorhamnose reductase
MCIKNINKMKIFVIGGTGILGSELKRINNEIICVGSEYDIYEFTKLKEKLDQENPDIIINCCAIKSKNVDNDPILAININIIGSSNISKYCIENNKRLVFISTDYVYPGETGNYSESDQLLPVNSYAWTKLSGEASTRLVSNHLIVRTSFGETIFDYNKAYKNLYTSKDYVDIIAPIILNVSISFFIGVLNIGTGRKSMYDYANRRNKIEGIILEVEKDFSLNTKLYENL